MNALRQFLSREAGQQRRANLDNALASFADYYLGPTGIPDRLRAIGILNPVNDMEQAYTKAGTVFSPDATGRERFDAGVGMVTDMATVLAPVAGGRMAGATADDAANLVDSLLGIGAMPREETANALRRFVVDEYGGPGANKGIRAYHGSPHDFDKFSMDKIGTGEGAQAYGHGLYFAESPQVAETYKNLNPVTDPTDGAFIYARAAWDEAKADPKKAVDWLMKKRAETEAASGFLTDGGESQLAQIDDAIERVKSGDLVKGRMYEVRINADPDDFLDWDKPLIEQPGVIQRLGMSARPEDEIHDEAYRLMMEGNAREDGKMWFDHPDLKARVDELQDELDRRAPNLTGQEYYRGAEENSAAGILSRMTNDGFGGRTETLRDAGIPGIKYLDAGSRGAGDGSRNYVVFDENLIEIVRKYGIAGAAAMLGVSEAELLGGMEGM